MFLKLGVFGGVCAGIGGFFIKDKEWFLRLGSLQNVFWYLKEQTELFAGQGGYDVKVGAHTQLDGAVIGSRAGADNRLKA